MSQIVAFFIVLAILTTQQTDRRRDVLTMFCRNAEHISLGGLATLHRNPIGAKIVLLAKIEEMGKLMVEIVEVQTMENIMLLYFYNEYFNKVFSLTLS